MEHFRAACSSCSSSGEHVQTYQSVQFLFPREQHLCSPSHQWDQKHPKAFGTSRNIQNSLARSSMPRQTRTMNLPDLSDLPSTSTPKPRAVAQTANSAHTLQKGQRGKPGSICVADKLKKKQDEVLHVKSKRTWIERTTNSEQPTSVNICAQVLGRSLFRHLAASSGSVGVKASMQRKASR